MEMTTKDRDEVSDKIMKGFKLAIKRMIERIKKEGGYLVISKNGKIEKVPAKEL